MISCLGDALYPRVGIAMVEVLERLGLTVSFPRAQTCCGQPAFNSGHQDDARRSAAAYARAFAGNDFVVSASGSCVAMVRKNYPSLLAGHADERLALAMAQRTFEFSQFLVDVLRVDDLPVRRRVRATFHHSCHTRRLLGVASQPERLLSMVDGLTYAPLPRVQDCCGFGGTFAVRMPMISGAMVDEKVDHILETDAELLIGLDMGCLANIEGRLRRRGAEIEVRHLAEVLAEGWRR